MSTDKWIICTLCGGDGCVVNPEIDAHGLTAEEMEDDEFREAYFSGAYDETCQRCGGSGKLRSDLVPAIMEQEDARAAERRLAAREDGDVEGLLIAGDRRFR